MVIAGDSLDCIHLAVTVVIIVRCRQPSIACKLQVHAYMDCLQDDLLAQIFKELSLHER